MKIVTWNCNGAFRKKFQKIASLEADIYIIQECENTESARTDYQKWAMNFFWHGKNKHKGIGIFVNPSVIVEPLNWPDQDLQYFLPVRINNQFNLIAVWTKEANSPTFKYIGQLWKYLQIHKDNMKTNTVICGDFNSNKRWDVWDRWWNHSDVIRELHDIGMVSLYHEARGQDQGAESSPTYYQHRKIEKAYHIDYAFSSKGMFNAQRNSVEVGVHGEWLEFSDHMPVTFTID